MASDAVKGQIMAIDSAESMAIYLKRKNPPVDIHTSNHWARTILLVKGPVKRPRRPEGLRTVPGTRSFHQVASTGLV